MTAHALLAAALRRFAQCAERELWARHAVPGPEYNVANQAGRDRVRVAELELNAAVNNTAAAASEVADLILAHHRPAPEPSHG